MTVFSPCPCGSQRPFLACCEPYLSGKAHAPTAEALMRSRYTAFCRDHLEYLMATHHPSTRTLGDRHRLRQSLQNTTWLGLTILQTQRGEPHDTDGMVEFVARYEAEYRGQLHERSRFIKRRDQWFYLKGEQLPPIEPKRNDPCWCGSGKKFKQCHGKR